MSNYEIKVKNGRWKKYSMHPEVKDISRIVLERDLKLFKKHEQLFVGRGSRAILRKFYNDIGERHFIEDQMAEMENKKEDLCAVIVFNIDKETNARLPVSQKALQDLIDNQDVLDLYSDKPSKGFN